MSSPWNLTAVGPALPPSPQIPGHAVLALWKAWRAEAARRRHQHQQLLMLQDKPEEVLDDIGAPPWMHEAARRRREQRNLELLLLRQGIISGANW